MRTLAPWLLPLAIVGCEGRPSRVLDAPDASSPALAAREGTPDALRIVTRAIGLDPAFDVLGARPGLDRGDLTSTGFRAPRAHVLGDLGVRLGARADQAALVGIGQSVLDRIEITSPGASPVPAQVHEGRVVYEGAYPGVDLVWAANESRAELFYVVHAPKKQEQFRLQLSRGARVTKVTEEAGSLRFGDDKGATIFVMPPAFAIDAKGTRRAVAMTFTEPNVVLTLDTEGLVPPIVVDPALETFRWVNQSFSTKPGPRQNAALSFDAGRLKDVLFGGADAIGRMCDTWVYTSATVGSWTQVGTAAPPTCTGAPPQREAHAMVNDATRDVVFLFGGLGAADALLNDAWTWNGSAWTEVCNSPACTVSRPSPRSAHAMAYDSARKVTVLFGGTDASGATCDTWEWNGTNWNLRLAGTGCGTGKPEARAGHQLAYDVKRGVTVLFGGTNTATPYLADTWEWNGSAGTWTKSTLSGPSGRHSFTMAYDSARERTILYSGKTVSTNNSRDVWEYDGAAWSDRTPGFGGPSPRDHASATFDARTRRFVLFGGLASPTPAPTGSVSAETWEFSSYGGACTSASQCDTGICEDGICCLQICGACQNCDAVTSAGYCGSVKSAEDVTGASCSGASYCDADAVCTTKVAKGGACTSSIMCATGNCVDGVCCDAACAGACKSCLAADTGLAQGTCGDVLSGKKRSSAGAAACAATVVATCGFDGFCNGAGACRNWAAGEVCGAASCPTATTAKAQQTCDGSGACKPTSEVACATGYRCLSGACKTTCAADGDCADSFFCSSSVCTAKKGSGAACTANVQCTTGFCTDGVCCDGACTGLCQACTAAKKGGGADGTCGAIADGADPDSECAAPVMFACNYGATGGDTCDGKGKCRQYAPAGTACAADTTCTGGKQTGQSCDGSGNCTPSGEVFCAPYLCDAAGKACRKSCDADTDCSDATYYCSSVKLCEKRKATGATCADARECSSGHCADGVCCTTACSGPCEACAEPSAIGVCKAVIGDPRGGRPACVGTGGCKGTCDGTTTSACVVPVGKECRNACADGKEIISKCDATGTCAAEPSAVCPNGYQCNTEGRCRTSCGVESDCVAGYSCEAGACTPKSNKCSDDGSSVIEPDGKTKTCSPFRCKGGVCINSCAASESDCLQGFICDATSKTCVPAAAATEGDDGGCSYGRGQGSFGAALLGLLAALSLRRRVGR